MHRRPWVSQMLWNDMIRTFTPVKQRRLNEFEQSEKPLRRRKAAQHQQAFNTLDIILPSQNFVGHCAKSGPGVSSDSCTAAASMGLCRVKATPSLAVQYQLRTLIETFNMLSTITTTQ